ncbi:unnamed protein product [Amoebophrya sp. A120]|nr:unnamed protein product [Amoebophrya sp. A120]|eukprot:GSA120T00022500001.1
MFFIPHSTSAFYCLVRRGQLFGMMQHNFLCGRDSA